jgi:hypothetical protein
MKSKGNTENFTFPPCAGDGSSRGVLTPAVKRLYESGVAPAEIRARALAVGWTAMGVNKALREVGYRERGYRSDRGVKDPLDVGSEAERILSHYPKANAALEFIDELREHIAGRRH